MKSFSFSNLKNQTTVLLKSPFLAPFSPSERFSFLKYCHRRSYKAGEYIWHQGDPGSGFYLIEDGKIELEINKKEGSTEGYDIVTCPDAIGVLSLIGETYRMTSTRCVTDCSLLGFFRPDFEILRDRNPRLAILVMQIVTKLAMTQLQEVFQYLKHEQGIPPELAVQVEMFPRHVDITLI